MLFIGDSQRNIGGRFICFIFRTFHIVLYIFTIETNESEINQIQFRDGSGQTELFISPQTHLETSYNLTKNNGAPTDLKATLLTSDDNSSGDDLTFSNTETAVVVLVLVAIPALLICRLAKLLYNDFRKKREASRSDEIMPVSSTSPYYFYSPFTRTNSLPSYTLAMASKRSSEEPPPTYQSLFNIQENPSTETLTSTVIE